MNFDNTKPFTIRTNGTATSAEDFLSKLHFFLTTTSNFTSVLDTVTYKIFSRDGFYYYFNILNEDGYDKVLFVKNDSTSTLPFFDLGFDDREIHEIDIVNNVEQFYLLDNGESIFISIEYNPGYFMNLFTGSATSADPDKKIRLTMSNKKYDFSSTDILYGYVAFPYDSSKITYFIDGIFKTINTEIFTDNNIEDTFFYLNNKYYLFNCYMFENEKLIAEVSDVFYSYMEGYQNAEEFSVSDKTFIAFPNHAKSSPPSSATITEERCIILRTS